MTTPPDKDRYLVAAAAFEETAFTEAELRELFMQRKITGETLVSPVKTGAWQKLSKVFPEWAATPLPALPPELPAPPPPATPLPAGPAPGGPHEDGLESPYGCHSTALIFAAVLLIIVGVATATEKIVLIFGFPLHWLCIGVAILLVLFGGLITFLSDITRRQQDTARKVDRLLAILEQNPPAGDGKPPGESNS